MWGYNEAGSYSGAVSTFGRLAAEGESVAFFRGLVETGAHAHSVRMLMAGEIAGAAIDSTFLAWLLEREPAVARAIRVIETIGPAAAPPILASRGLTEPARSEIRRLLLSMHKSDAGMDALAAGDLVRLAPGRDAGYERIREADLAATQAGFFDPSL
jgi:ABC-type phosphate/phosphonate transport system substrate-binding protein